MVSFFLSRNIHTSKDPDSQMWSIYFCDLIVYDSQVKQKLFSESTPVSQSLSMNAPVDICCKQFDHICHVSGTNFRGKMGYAAYGLRIHKKFSREGKDQNYMITAEEVVNSAIPDRVSCQAVEGELGEMEQGKKLKQETRISQIKNYNAKVKVKIMIRYTKCIQSA